MTTFSLNNLLGPLPLSKNRRSLLPTSCKHWPESKH